MAIIVVLASILVPIATSAYRNSARARLGSDLQALAAGLEAYRQDFAQYPPVTARDTGCEVLCHALISPDDDDGQAGPGFRTRKNIGGEAQSKVWGPYVPAERFTVDRVSLTSPYLIRDSYGNPILYYPGHTGADIHARNGFCASVPGFYKSTVAAPVSSPWFNAADNDKTKTSGKLSPLVEKALQSILGDTNQNGKIDGTETPAFSGPFLLISAGPDGAYGPAQPDQPITSSNRCDDVANFSRTEY